MTSLVEAAAGGVRAASPLLILIAGGVQVMTGRLSLGAMLSLSSLAGAFLAPLGSLLATIWQVQQTATYLERINDVLDTAPEQDHSRLSKPGRLTGQIDLAAVSFRYSPLAAEAVREVNLQIRPGQFVGIVGRSGSGKSTLAKLLLGLYPPTTGRIAYDGLDLADLDRRAVRSQMGVVTQQPSLFGTTIREAIAGDDPGVSLADVAEATRLAQIDDWIRALPLGYETRLAENGSSLSGGQRQRLALARALVGRPQSSCIGVAATPNW
jgi:ABC-type bacteriocin/lantibiotic exporter with double-glycine peptidase domain